MAHHYKELFNSIPVSDAKQAVLSSVAKTCPDLDSSTIASCLFSSRDVELSIAKLKKGKAPGSDLLCPEHLCYAHPSLSAILYVF